MKDNTTKILLAIIALAVIFIAIRPYILPEKEEAVQDPVLKEKIQPTEAREEAEEEYLVVGSVNSDKYHYPWCRWAKKISPQNKVTFSSPEEARKKGYKPCKVCGPP